MRSARTRICASAMGAAALVVACLAGCTAAADTTVPTVTESQAHAELSQYGNINGGYNNVSDEEATYSNDAVSITVKDGKKHVVSLGDAKKIFSATVDGKTYSFPCDVKDVEADGWEYSDSNLWRVSKMDEGRVFEPSFGENDVVFKKGDADEYGTSDNELFLSIANAFSKERAYWEDCSVLGMAYYATEDDMANGLAGKAEFSSGIGIDVGDSIDKVIDLFGCWKYYDDSLDKESDLFAIYVELDGEEVPIGYVNFFQTDGVVTFVNAKVNVNYADALS